MSDEHVRVEALHRGRHHLADFACGNPVLDRWLRASAGQAQRADVARTYVAVSDSHAVAGYYTLVAGQVEHAGAPPTVSKGASRHFPIPIGLIARLAIASSHQGRGLGSDLLRDAVRRLVAASEEIGLRAALVHAIDERAAAFCRHHGFDPATNDNLTLMIPLAAARITLVADDT